MMKKLVFLFLFVLSFSALRSQIQIGIKAGYNLSSFYAGVVPNVSYTAKSDFNAGFFLSFKLGSRFNLQPEAVYSGQGAGIEIINVNGQNNIQYLNFPILIKYRVASRFFIETGPQMGFVLGSQLNENGFPSVNIKDQTKSPDYSWVFGIGYQLPIGLGLDIRYNLGLTDIADDNSNSYNDASIKNSVFQIGIFYLFGN